MGKLYICGTPIGNMEDVSIRLLKTLRKVDLIACEDTRHTIKLLNRYKIKKPLLSYHEHSHKGREDYILQQLEQGATIALVSDAGMPTISDPGSSLINKAIAEGVELEVIPGPSAFTAALAISGLDTSTFTFAGFLPPKAKKRQDWLRNYIDTPMTVIFYEAPHRLLASLNDMISVYGEDRTIVVARELTKHYEEVKRGSIAKVREHFETFPPKGEICLLLAKKEKPVAVELDQIMAEVKELIEAGVEKKVAFKKKAEEYAIKKSSLYNYYVRNED